MAGPSSRIAELLDHSHGSRKVDPGRIADFRDLVDRDVPPHIAAVEAGLSEADEHFLRMSGELGTTLEGGDSSTSTALPTDDGSTVAKAVDTEASPAGNGQLSDDGDHPGQLRNEARLQGPLQGFHSFRVHRNSREYQSFNQQSDPVQAVRAGSVDGGACAPQRQQWPHQ